jgi:ankyrin repeat protein
MLRKRTFSNFFFFRDNFMSISHQPSIREQLLVACKQGRHDLIPNLRALGADLIRFLDGCDTALHIAAQKGHTALIQVLIESKVNPNIRRSYDKATPVYLAAKNGHEEAIRTLIELNGDPNLITVRQVFTQNEVLLSPEYTPIFAAAGNGHANCVRLLIEKGADFKSLNFSGRTPLDIARGNKHEVVVKILENARKIRQESLLLEANQATTLRGLCCSRLTFLVPSKDVIPKKDKEIGNNVERLSLSNP